MSISSSFPSISPSLTLDFAKSRHLDPRITFTRAQTGNIATYTGSDGLIKYAGPDEPRFDHKQTFRTNLIKHSENFDLSTEWSASGGSVITLNQETAPDGSLTADRAEVLSWILQTLPSSSVKPNTNYTFSIWIKSATGSNQQVQLWWEDQGVIAGNGQYVTITNEWQRFSITGTCPASPSVFRPSIRTGDYYLWGAQVEEGDIATDYIATGPNPVTRTATESLGLLVEEQRANYLLYSEDYLSTTNTVQSTVTPNAQISPDGTQTADTITADNIPSTQHGSNKQSSSLPANSTIALSVFVKAGTTSYVKLDTSNTTNWSQNAGIAVDLSNGNIITGTGEVKEYPNGWWRITVYGVTNSSTSVPRGLWVWISNASGASVISTSGTETIYVWGAQAEVGSFPTSYIPTSGTAITRPRDLAKISPTNMEDFYSFNEGTYLVEGIIDATLLANTYGGIFGVGSGGGNSNFLNYNPTNNHGYYASNTGQSPASSLTKTYTPGTKYKLSGSYDSTGFSASADGDISSNTSTGVLTTAAVNGLFIGSNAITSFTYGVQTIAKASYYPKRLSDSQLQTLTK